MTPVRNCLCQSERLGRLCHRVKRANTSGSRRSVPREKCLTLRIMNTHVGCISEKYFCVAKGSVEQDSTSHGNRGGMGDGSLFKALDELCLNRTVHPSISLSHHRCCWNKSVGDACMHDDRLCEERKKRCFRADLTVIPPSPILLFAIKAEIARWKNLQRSYIGAIVQKPKGPNTYDLKIWL